MENQGATSSLLYGYFTEVEDGIKHVEFVGGFPVKVRPSFGFQGEKQLETITDIRTFRSRFRELKKLSADTAVYIEIGLKVRDF